MYTTLNKIRDCHPCRDGWSTLLEFLDKTGPDDDRLSLLTILESNGFEDAVWCLRAVPGYDREKRAFMAECVRKLEQFFSSSVYSDFLLKLEAYGAGEISEEEFVKAQKQIAAHQAQHDDEDDEDDGCSLIDAPTDYLVKWAFAGNNQGRDSGVMVWHTMWHTMSSVNDRLCDEEREVLNSKLIQLIGS